MNNRSWWGNGYHKLFTLIVFVILASLDNTARGVLPPLYAVISRDLSVSEAALGSISALTILVVAVTAVVWGYQGDRRSRKPLLLYGTLIWSTATFFSGLSQNYGQLLLFQFITAVGIGCISSIGFSVINDFIPPARRGLALSFWGLSQGGGAGAGALLGGSLGATHWPLPFFLIAAAGLLFAILYLFTFEPERGRSEPELAPLFAAGGDYEHHIELADIRQILTIPTNRWLILLTFIASVGYGSRIWMSRLFIAKVEAAGHSLATSTITGNLLALLFEAGFYFAILGGYLGDRWQRRNPSGRAVLSLIGMLGAIPFQITVYFIPLRDLSFPESAGLFSLIGAVLLSIVTNPWVASTFVVALIGIAFISLEPPNRTALFTDVNLPEHRGTIAGVISIATGIGLALGNSLAGVVISHLEAHLALPLNYVVGLSLFQLLFIPAGLCYYQVMKIVGQDIGAMRQILAKRAEK